MIPVDRLPRGLRLLKLHTSVPKGRGQIARGFNPGKIGHFSTTAPEGNAVKDSRSRALPWNALIVRLRLTFNAARRSLESSPFPGRARERGPGNP
jgi:hypothetical protein